jgi:methyl-accepting chemotaxis protein
MRQNMEELQATQEEAARRAGEVEGLVSSLSASAYLVEYDLNGTIINVNDSYVNRLGVKRHEILGKHHSDHVEMTEQQKDEYNKFWDDLRSGHSKKVKTSINWDGKVTSFIENYFPIVDGEGHAIKIMKLAYELEDFK